MTKSIFIIVLTFSTLINVNAQQRFRAGLKVGIATTQVEGDTYAGFNKLGFSGGAFVVGKLNEKWSAQFELLFIQKGSKHNGDINQGDYSYYAMKLNYIEVPLLIKYHQKKITYEAGPAYGYLISGKEYNFAGQYYSAIPFKSSEISFGVGVNYSFSDSWAANVRYSNSLIAIRSFNSGVSKWNTPGQRNNVIQLTLTRIFGIAQ